jgi:hypothetical protein
MFEQQTDDLAPPPLWIWHVVRTRDLPVVRVEGLLPDPQVWLLGTKRAARGCLPHKDRTILRVDAQHLDRSKLVRDTHWQQWVSDFKLGSNNRLPPPDLLRWFIKLRRRTDPFSSERMEYVLKSGKFDPVQLQRDLAPQINNIRWNSLWQYQSRVLPTSLAYKTKTGFWMYITSPVPKDVR